VQVRVKSQWSRAYYSYMLQRCVHIRRENVRSRARELLNDCLSASVKTKQNKTPKTKRLKEILHSPLRTCRSKLLY